MRKFGIAASALIALFALSGCKTANSAVNGVRSAGETVASGVSGAATSLVNVNLSNVLNNLALQLKVDRANIPVNIQLPITVAANICGVSINILSVSQGGTSRGCTAVTTSPQLTQAVQQQLSTGGGTQTTTAPAPAPTTPPPTTSQPTQPVQDSTTTPPKLD